MRQRLDGVRGAEPVDALTSMARWYKPGSSTEDVTTNLLIVLIAPALAVVHALLLLKVLMALRRLLRSDWESQLVHLKMEIATHAMCITCIGWHVLSCQ